MCDVLLPPGVNPTAVKYISIYRKGIGGGSLERQTQLEEEDNIINKWAQEDVSTLHSMQNNKKKLLSIKNVF
jgi:hypothetical protein